AECRLGLCHSASNLLQIPHVHWETNRATPHTLDLLGNVRGTRRVEQAKRNVGTRIGKCQRDGTAKSAGRARHQCGTAFELEARKLAHGRLSLPRRLTPVPR